MEHLSFTGKRWTVRQDLRGQLPAGSPHVDRQHLVQRLLRERGIEALHPGNALGSFGPDALLFPDMEQAALRIEQAVAKQERIGIFGDYDCDGVTSTAILTRFLRRHAVQPIVRLPHRLHEGYGLKAAIVQEFIHAGVTLLLTVDTGITAIAEIEMAAGAGIDVIVMDHHHVPVELPTAFALLHPALAPGFPLPHPSAAGIAWSVVRLLEERSGAPWPDRESDIALAAIGTVGDLVEMRGANRTLVHQGLRALAGIERGPLALLTLQAGMSGSAMTSRDIAFRLAPRLNAAGRMDDPIIALQALLGDEGALLRLEELNRQRQELVSSLMEEAMAAAGSSSFLCIKNERYMPGICGLLAGKLTERAGRPSLVAYAKNGMCVASLRSIPAYHVTQGLHRNGALFQSFGGHAAAAGCTFQESNFETIAERLTDDIEATVDPQDLTPMLAADFCVDARDLSMQLCQDLRLLEPFGQGNPEPTFLLRSIQLQAARAVGKDGAHLQAMVQGKKMIGFHMGRYLPDSKKSVDLLCHLGIDTWQGTASVQLFLDDMRSSIPEENPKMQVSNTKEIPTINR